MKQHPQKQQQQQQQQQQQKVSIHPKYHVWGRQQFCAIKTSAKPPPPDPEEPQKVAEAVAKWDIDYVVLTSVDRDDLPDGGAQHFADTVKLIKKKKPQILVECLVSDFQGSEEVR
ncbi:lipoic acid synthase, putative [Eimeria praecox]|uniref:Lipoic acid synthase, putative n=1 Tax=Eimeria praecox TaxID=51316 RepID=U6GS71_9EIME|nr:lipoic acid synthase, putative [Eimeria praecox]